MVEIRYGERYEMADLAGKSVAQAREQYKPEFGIPDKAQASLNGKGIGKKHEPMTALGDNDSLTFAQKSRKGLFFIGAILLAAAITGGIFAYGATTVTIGLTLADYGDFVEVTLPAGQPTWDVFGSYKGRVDTGNLFSIAPETNWTGDMGVILTITNAEELVECYRILVLEIQIIDTDGTGSQVGTTEYLTLGKGEVDIEFSQTTDDYMVELTGGFYITHRGGWTTGQEDPSIFCQVLQRSAPPAP